MELTPSKRRWSRYHLSPVGDIQPAGGCVVAGCTNLGWDITEGFCPDHFSSEVVTTVEDELRSVMDKWGTACELESRQKESWSCACGFIASYSERDSHFVSNEGDPAHRPPIADAPRRLLAGKRLTPKTPQPQVVKLDEIG